MDPFEARLQFQQMLKTLTSSNNNNLIIVKFLNNNHTLIEDLYSCMLEAINNTHDYNYKVNFIQLVNIILEQQQQQQKNLVSLQQWLMRDLKRLFNRVLIDDKDKEYSAINVSSAYTILVSISETRGLNTVVLSSYMKRFQHLRAQIGAEDQAGANAGASSKKPELMKNDDSNMVEEEEKLKQIWEKLIEIRQYYKNQRLLLSSSLSSSTIAAAAPAPAGEEDNKQDPSPNPQPSSIGLQPGPVPGLYSEKLLLRRMEDDRERTKKLKEGLWENKNTSTTTTTTEEQFRDEFEELVLKYNSRGGNGGMNKEDNFKDMSELNIIASQCYNDWTKKELGV